MAEYNYSFTRFILSVFHVLPVLLGQRGDSPPSDHKDFRVEVGCKLTLTDG